MATVLLELPAELRDAFKEPLGPVYTDTEALLADAGTPLVAVGDVVTAHLLAADVRPTVAFVDGKTQRSAVEDDLAPERERFDRQVAVENPAATLTEELLGALREELDGAGTTLVVVDGEEDLAALPALLAVPDGGSVVYGQPGEGMVLVTPDQEDRELARSLLARMDGDSDRALSVLRA